MKIVGSDKAIRSPEFHKRKLREKRFKVALVVAILAIIFVGPVLLLRNARFLIASVSVAGNDVTPKSEIESVVEENLAGAYAWVLPKKSAVLYPRASIERELLEKIPRFSSAEVSLDGARAVAVEVTERKPQALYCEGSEKPRCFFIDDTGYIFSEAPEFSGEVYIQYRTEPALEKPVGTQLFEPSVFEKLELFLYNLKVLDIAPETVIRVGDEYELRQPAGPLVKWREDQDLERLLVDFESFLHNSGLKKADIERMSYIDLRFDSKVFYRFQGE